MEKIDISDWLKKNKLETIDKAFKERDISIEELTEFNDTELNEFASELQLDTLARKRFVKAVEALRPSSQEKSSSTKTSSTQQSTVSSSNDTKSNTTSSTATATTTATTATTTTTTSTSDINKTTTVATLPPSASQEEHCMKRLNVTYDKTIKLIDDIRNSFDALDLSTKECSNLISSTFDSLLKEVDRKEELLINQGDLLKDTKSKQLHQQSDSLKNYNVVLDETKSKYDGYITDQTLETTKRKKIVLEMISGMMKYPGISLLFITQPRMTIKDYKPVLSAFVQGLTVDDCDQPMPFSIWITKMSGDEVTIEWRLNDRDIVQQSIKPVTALGVEWSVLPKTKVPKPDSKIFEKAKQKPVDINTTSNDGTERRKSKISMLFAWLKSGGSNHLDVETSSQAATTTDEETDKDKESKDKKKEKKKNKKKKDKSSDDEDEDEDEDEENKSDKDDKKSDDEKSDSEKSDKDKDKDSDEASDKEKEKEKKKEKKKEKDKKKKKENEEKETAEEEKINAIATDFQSIVENVDPSKLKWKKNDETIKPAKVQKYKIKNLKEEMPYAIRARAKNSSGWGVYTLPIIVWTPKLTIDSKIMKAKEKIKLLKFVPKSKKFKWKLIYRASKDGFSASNFHTKCNGKMPTVTVVKSKMNHVFGGFTEVAWTSSGNYASDANAFLFLLRSSRKDKPEKFACKNTSYSLNHNGSYGPTFGGGYDFYLCDNCNTVQSSYSNFGHSYGTTSDQSKLAGSYNFLVDDYEVYHLKK